MKQLLIAGIMIGLLMILGVFLDVPEDVENITSFEECAEKYAVMESYPRQCRIPGGTLFVEDIGGSLF